MSVQTQNKTMALFQKSVLNKYLKTLDDTKVQTAYQQFKASFQTEERIKIIRSMKEEEYQAGFLDDLFVKVLGYTLKPNDNFNLELEKKNTSNAKKADGAILINGEVEGVIELKSTSTTDIRKIEYQAFGYKSTHPKCTYVITSNFAVLRLYVNDTTSFEDFHLFDLTEDQFKILYLLLSWGNISNGIPSKIKNESVLQEEEITKKLYKDYSHFKIQLFNSIKSRNTQFDELLLFKKTQKLLDRFLFIFFAEDKGLLPPNSISRIIDRFNLLEEEDAYKPLYDIFKQYFGYINKGREAKGKRGAIFAFNGGLFAPDEVLDNLEMSDKILMNNCRLLSGYDFETDVDVNILGHIFEHSLNEIEEISAQIAGKALDKNKTKRKKDGVFYTPKYITKYIVENTIGKLCEEKKDALGIDVEEYLKDRKGRTKKKLKALEQQLQDYQDYLMSLRICDPACGSGAFLNQAFNFLIEEHEYIAYLRRSLFGESIQFDMTNDILEKNLYGVDINDESVDIAKLSLWLRTAKKGRTLATLNNNLKCGNSLIDDPTVAGEKAFDWEKEFPEVFANGGFDVIIGNPPYGAKISKEEKLYFKSNYEVTEYNFDTYNFFFEFSLKILKREGFLGSITPNTFLVVENGILLRKLLFNENTLLSLYETFNVFPDAVVEPITSIIQKKKANDDIKFDVILTNRNSKSTEKREFSHGYIRSKNKLILNYRETKIEKSLYSKIQNKSVELGTIAQVTTGIKPYQTGKGKPKQTKDIVQNKPFTSFEKQVNWNPLIRGTQINRYSVKWNGEYIKYGEWLAEPRKPEIFFNPKIFIRRTDDKLLSSFDSNNYVGVNSVHCIQSVNKGFDEKNLMCQINSKLVNWFFRHENFHMVGKPLAEVKVIYVERLPIFNSKKISFENLADTMLNKKNDLLLIQSKFIRLVKRKFKIEKLQRNLQNWHILTFADFVKELKKKKIKLGLAEEAEWEDYFEAEKAKALTLQATIDQTDKEIDQMVYQLYGLTEEEIEIVENS